MTAIKIRQATTSDCAAILHFIRDLADYEKALRDAAPDVTATTCVTKWQGESCDYGMAIDGLLRRDGNLRFRGEMDPALPGVALTD